MEIIPPAIMIPDSIEVLTGTIINGGSVESIQTQYNGDIIEIAEEVATPGMEIRINFINILRYRKLIFSAYYDGRASHYIHVQMWNYLAHEWEIHTTLNLALDISLYSFECTDCEEHIKNGNVIVRFHHELLGNPVDDTHIGYVALLR